MSTDSNTTATATAKIAAGLVTEGSCRHLVDGPFGALQLAGAGDTGGVASFLIHPLAPRALGSPVHTHTNEDEWTYILEGEVGLEVGDKQLLARPGDLVLKPRGIPHAFWNPTDQPARMLEVVTPGGFEKYFEEIGEILASSQPDMAALGAVAARYGLQMDPASVPRLIAAHALDAG
jgi:uncharacterized cupin superfamily protein